MSSTSQPLGIDSRGRTKLLLVSGTPPSLPKGLTASLGSSRDAMGPNPSAEPWLSGDFRQFSRRSRHFSGEFHVNFMT